MARIPPGVRRALRLPLSSERLTRELDDEVRFHVEMRVSELMAAGFTEQDARAQALERFGDADDLRQYIKSIGEPYMRHMRWRERWESWRQDLRFAARQVARGPAFYAIAASTLALGIAATTSIFSVMRGVLLRPLPFPQADRVVQVWQVNAQGRPTNFSDANFDDVRAQSTSFSALAEFSSTGVVAVSGTSEPVRAEGARVSHDFFNALGVKPSRGRAFVDEEMRENGAPAVIISDGFWRRSFGGSPTVIGQQLRFEGALFSIVGIMPAGQAFPLNADFWIPRELSEKLPSRTAQNWETLGRLKDGVTIGQARSDVTAIARRLKAQFGNDTWMVDASVVPLHDQLVGGTKLTLTLLMVGSLVLLLIACANVINLLIARMTARGGEMALRAALGASASRLLQQCTAEALVLTAFAAALGVALATAGVRVLLAIQPGNLPRMNEVRVDGLVLAFAVLVAAACAVVMGIIAAWRAGRGNLRDELARLERAHSGSRASERTRRSLVIAQVAMAVVLLVGGGLLTRSFVRIMSVEPGFRAADQVVVDLSLNDRDAAQRRRALDVLASRFRAIPSVTEVGGINGLPLSGEAYGNGVFLIFAPGDEKLAPQEMMKLAQNPDRVGQAEFRVASPGYFRAMGIPLVRGRVFDDRDAPDAPHVAVISASLVKARWPNEDPIGKVIEFGNMDGDLRPFTIVGVVGDVREQSLAADPRPTFYASYRQRANGTSPFSFVLAISGSASSVMRAARQVVRDVRPDVPPRLRTVAGIVNGSVADRRFVLWLVAVFGTAALVLAALGVYSVIAYLVTLRGREISIRIALGAERQDILRMIMQQGMSMTLVGIAIGAIAAYLTTGFVAKLLYDITPSDPIAFGGVVVVLTLVALGASWFPARRAARLKATDVLRAG